MTTKYEPGPKTIMTGWFFMVAFIIAVVMLVLCACSTSAQTLTNEDLGKKLHHAPATADVYEALKAHEYHAPPSCTRCDGPYFASTGAKTPYAGPWDWPEERPARRLDGTLVDSPPIVYGELPWFYPRGYAWHSGFSERERMRANQRRRDDANHDQVIRRR
jgi:hypothetical protein